MSKRAALIVAGIITALAVLFVLGAAALPRQSGQVAAAAGSPVSSTAATSGACVNSSDVAALQSRLADYQAALQQANTQLQDAYNQIAAYQAQGGFGDEHEQGEHEGSFFNPFGGD